MAAENVQIFDPHTGKYRAAKAADKDLVAEHEAQIAGKPAPGDRTAEQLRELEPGFAAPVSTAAAPNETPTEPAAGGARVR